MEGEKKARALYLLYGIRITSILARQYSNVESECGETHVTEGHVNIVCNISPVCERDAFAVAHATKLI